MGMEITNSYNGVYESIYAVSKKETVTTQKSTETAKKNSNEEYLKSLQKQVPYIKLQTGYGINTNNDGKVNIVDVNPKLLEKMQNDPKAAKEYTQRLKDVEAAAKWVDGFEKSMGCTAICRHGYVDENGNYSNFAVVVRKDDLNEKLRKEAQENAEKQIEKTRENTHKRAEELEVQLEEKVDETKKTGGEHDDSVAIVKEETVQDKAEKLLSEKLDKSENGVIFLDSKDTKVIIEAAKEDGLDKPNAKEQAVVGGRIDLQV